MVKLSGSIRPLAVQVGHVGDQVPVALRDRREVGLAVADRDAVLGGHAPDAVHRAQVLGEAVVDHERERDLVRLAVAVGVAVAERDQHVTQLAGGGRRVEAQGVEPAPVDHVVLLQVVGLQEVEPRQRLHLSLRVHHVGQRLRLLGEDPVQVRRITLAEVLAQVGHHALLQQLGDQVLVQAGDAEHHVRVVIRREHDRHLLGAVHQHPLQVHAGRLAPALHPRVVLGIVGPGMAGHHGNLRLDREYAGRRQLVRRGSSLVGNPKRTVPPVPPAVPRHRSM